MNIYTAILLEFLFIASTILLLFRFRSNLGLAPLYILLGAIQYLQVFASTYISIEILEEYTIYPAATIIFSGVLFAVLLIYIKEGVISARTLILGIIISNFVLTALAGITYFQEIILGMISENSTKSTFILDYKYFIIGTIILLFDFILLVILYQFLISRASKLHYFLILFISLASVLFFDSVVFNVILKFGDPEFTASLVGHIIGKSLAAFGFSLLLYIYIIYIDKEKINIGFITDQRRDIFSIITYKKKYLDLKVEKEQVEEKLVSQLESTLNNISDGFVSLDTNWCFTYVNINAGEFLRRSPKSLIGKHIWTEFPESVGLPFYNAYHKAVETQQTQYFQEYYQPLQRWFENRVYPTSEGLTIYFTDITEKRNAEELLKKSEKYLDNIINHIGDPVFVKDEHSRFLLVNDAFCTFFGRTRDNIIGKTLAENISPEEMEHFLRIDNLVLRTGEENIIEEPLTGKDGRTRTLFTRKSRFIDNKGKKFLIGIIRDITDLKVAEEGQIHLTNIIEESLNEIYVFDADTWLFQYANSGAIKNIGYSMEEMANMTPLHIKPDFTEAKFRELLTPLKSNEKTKMEFETRHLRKDKSSYPVEIHLQRIAQKDKDVYLAVILDITERKKVEIDLNDYKDKLEINNAELVSLANHLQDLREEERKALAREIHDDLGQTLTSLKLDLVGVKNRLDPSQDTEIKDLLGAIDLSNQAIKTIQHISSELRPGIIDDLGLIPAIEWYTDQFHDRSKIKINLEVKIDEEDIHEDYKIAIYRIIQESLTNIIRHAKATSVTIILEKLDTEIVLYIKDNGIGISNNELKKSNSFGLMGMRERAHAINGEILIVGRKKEGTTIKLNIPLKIS